MNPLAGVPIVDAGNSSFSGASHEAAVDHEGGFRYDEGADYGENPLMGASDAPKPSAGPSIFGRKIGSADKPDHGVNPFVETSTVDYPTPTSSRLRRR